MFMQTLIATSDLQQNGRFISPHSCAAGQQESKIESLESIHAARLRSGSEAGTSAPQLAQPAAAAPARSQSGSDDDDDADASAAGVSNGGLGEEDVELDPYVLPVSHEVALEGAQPFRLCCQLHTVSLPGFATNLAQREHHIKVVTILSNCNSASLEISM